MRITVLLIIVWFHFFGAYSQKTFEGWEDSMAAQPAVQKLAKDVCKCWTKQVRKLPECVQFRMENFEIYETYQLDMENYYDGDTASMNYDNHLISESCEEIQSCIIDLHKKHNKILEEYNYLELYSPLMMCLQDEKGMDGYMTFFEIGVFSTHPEQLEFTSLIGRLLNDVQNEKYSQIGRVTDRMRSIIQEAAGDTTIYITLLEEYKNENPDYYQKDMSMMETYVLPNLENQLQRTKERFRDTFGELSISDIDFYFTEFDKYGYSNTYYAIARSLVEMRLSTE